MMAESRMSKQSYLTTGSYAQRNENVPKKQRPQKAKIQELKPEKKPSKHVVANSYGVKQVFNPFGQGAGPFQETEPGLGGTQQVQTQRFSIGGGSRGPIYGSISPERKRQMEAKQ